MVNIRFLSPLESFLFIARPPQVCDGRAFDRVSSVEGIGRHAPVVPKDVVDKAGGPAIDVLLSEAVTVNVAADKEGAPRQFPRPDVGPPTEAPL